MNLFDYLFIIGATLCFLWFCFKYIIDRSWLISVRKTDAVVEDVEREESLFGSVMFSYKVSFILNEKIAYSKLKGYLSPFVYSVGQKIKILCNKKDPTKTESFSLKGKLIVMTKNILVVGLVALGLLLSIKLVYSMPTSSWLYFLIAGDFMILSIAMILEGLILLFEVKKKSITAKGRVKEFLERQDQDGDKIFVPVIEYSYNGIEILFQSNTVYSDTKMLNKDVEIIHLENLPMIAEIKSPYNNWWRIIFWCLCLIVSGLGFVILMNSQ